MNERRSLESPNNMYILIFTTRVHMKHLTFQLNTNLYTIYPNTDARQQTGVSSNR